MNLLLNIEMLFEIAELIVRKISTFDRRPSRNHPFKPLILAG